jgi:hypothetical protein
MTPCRCTILRKPDVERSRATVRLPSASVPPNWLRQLTNATFTIVSTIGADYTLASPPVLPPDTSGTGQGESTVVTDPTPPEI